MNQTSLDQIKPKSFAPGTKIQSHKTTPGQNQHEVPVAEAAFLFLGTY